VINRQAEHNRRSHHDLAVLNYSPLLDAPDAEDGAFRHIDDGREGVNIEHAQVSDGESAAAEVIGVHDVRFLGYPDGILQPTLELRRELTRLIRQVRPDRVVCQDPTTVLVEDGYINHPDHRAAGEATLYAVFPSAGTRPIFPELLKEGLEPHQVKELYLTLTTRPNTHVDISSTIDRKIKALLCHKSQVGLEVEEWLREWDSEAGREAGCAYAEQFYVMRFD